MKLLPFLNTTTQSSSSDHHQPKSPSSPWRQWRAACAHLETLSFRATKQQGTALENNMEASINFIESTPLSCSTNTWSEEAGTLTTTRSDESAGSDRIVDTVIRGLRSDRRHRLVFDPAGKSNSILEVEDENTDKLASTGGGRFCGSDSFPYKESVFMSMESKDPLADFRISMEEMIEAHGFKDWECLEELLGWYLKVNAKGNHVYIIGAFIDLLVGLCSRSCSSSASLSSSSVVPSSSSRQQSGKTEMAAAVAGANWFSSASASASSSSSSSLSSSLTSTYSPSSTLSLDQVDEKDDGEEICHRPS